MEKNITGALFWLEFTNNNFFIPVKKFKLHTASNSLKSRFLCMK